MPTNSMLTVTLKYTYCIWIPQSYGVVADMMGCKCEVYDVMGVPNWQHYVCGIYLVLFK